MSWRTKFQVLLYLISKWHYFVYAEWIHLSRIWTLDTKSFSRPLFQKEAFEIRFMDSDSWNEPEVNFLCREKLSRRDYLDYLLKFSKFMQARVRLSCSDSLICTGLHTFRRHASPPQEASDGIYWTLVRSPRDDFFLKIIRPNFSFGAPEEKLTSEVRNAMQHLHLILGRNALWCSRQNK